MNRGSEGDSPLSKFARNGEIVVTDEQRQRIHKLKADGLEQKVITRDLGVSEATVSRIVREREPVENGAAERAARAFIASLGELDAMQSARAAILAEMAKKLDWCQAQTTGASAAAAASLARHIDVLMTALSIPVNRRSRLGELVEKRLRRQQVALKGGRREGGDDGGFSRRSGS